MADVNTTGQMWHFLKRHTFLEQPSKDFGTPCNVRALQFFTFIVLTFDLFAIFNNLFFPYFQRVSYNKFSATRTAAPFNFWPHARLRFSEILSTRAPAFFNGE